MTNTNDVSDDVAASNPGEVLTWKVGNVRITRVGELVSAAPRDMLLPDITDLQLTENADWLGPYFVDGMINLAFQTLIVESEGKVIVVDTCLGDDPVRMMPGDASFPDRVAAEIDGGLDAVDMVLCTHLHFDHVGWNTRVLDGLRLPTFPNARYLFTQAELDHVRSDDHHNVIPDDVQPLLDAGLVDIIEPHHNLTSEVRTFSTAGHSPGHVSVLITSGPKDEQAVITGDAFHSPIQVRYPEIAATPFDWNSAMSSDTRRAMLENFSDTDALIVGTHFAPPTAGYVKSRADHLYFEPDAP